METKAVKYTKIRNPNCVVFIVKKWNMKTKKPIYFLNFLNFLLGLFFNKKLWNFLNWTVSFIWNKVSYPCPQQLNSFFSLDTSKTCLIRVVHVSMSDTCPTRRHTVWMACRSFIAHEYEQLIPAKIWSLTFPVVERFG